LLFRGERGIRREYPDLDDQQDGEKCSGNTHGHQNDCQEVWKIEVTRGWVDSFISRYSAELIEKSSSSQEARHLQVPRVFLDDTVRSMHDAVQGRPADLVFNSILMKSGHPLGRPTTEEGAGSENHRAPFDSSSIILDCETYVGHGLHMREWGVSHSVRRDVLGLRGNSPGSGDGRDANWTPFHLETPRQSVCQR
jgi:hypothetical protein